ncbi:hypothetical protein BgiBS90_012762 [Biomphalaria glabrata]|nr:hypothetical protein BgiBS90_012762 [Biomphalaria glabrata]
MLRHCLINIGRCDLVAEATKSMNLLRFRIEERGGMCCVCWPSFHSWMGYVWRNTSTTVMPHAFFDTIISTDWKSSWIQEEMGLVRWKTDESDYGFKHVVTGMIQD